MKEEPTTEQRVKEAVADLQKALLADIEAKAKVEEINREKTKTHYDLLKAKERLATLEVTL